MATHSSIVTCRIPWTEKPGRLQSCPTLCNLMDCSMSGLSGPHHLLKFAQVHVHYIGVAILWCPLLLPSIFPSIRDFSNESAVCIRWPKYWSFSFSIILPTSVQGWFPLRLPGLIFLLSKGISRVFSSTTVRRHQYAWMYLLLILFFWSTLTGKIPINESGNCTSSSQSLFVISTLNHFLSKMWIWWSGCFFMEHHEF